MKVGVGVGVIAGLGLLLCAACNSDRPRAPGDDHDAGQDSAGNDTPPSNVNDAGNDAGNDVGGTDARADATGAAARVFGRVVSGGAVMRSSRFRIIGAVDGNGAAVSASTRFELRLGTTAAQPTKK